MGNPNLATKVTVTLDFPFEVDGTSYLTLDMRRPKVADNVAAQKQKGGDFEKGIFMLARLCDVPPEVIHELDELDAAKLQDELNSFRGDAS